MVVFLCPANPDRRNVRGEMARSPRWKVCDATGEYVASFKHVEDAAVLVASYGDGTTIRDGKGRGRPVVWTEGHDGKAGESYDYVAEIVEGRTH